MFLVDETRSSRFSPVQPNAPRPNRSLAVVRSSERSLDLDSSHPSSSIFEEHTPRRKTKPLSSDLSHSPPPPHSSVLFSPRSVALNERHKSRAAGNTTTLLEEENHSGGGCGGGLRRELSWDVLADCEFAPPTKAARFAKSGLSREDC